MKKPALLIISLVLIIVVLSIVKTFISNNIATSGVALSAVEQRIGSIKTENSLLSQKLYSYASLTSIYERAERLGFVKNAKSYVLTSQYPIASRQ